MKKIAKIAAIQTLKDRQGIAVYDSVSHQLCIGVNQGQPITSRMLVQFVKQVVVNEIVCPQSCIEDEDIGLAATSLDIENVIPIDNVEFDFIVGQRRLFGGQSSETNEISKNITIDPDLDQNQILTNQHSIGCAGALLAYLQRMYIDEDCVPSIYVKSIAIKCFLIIDKDAQSYLQIFDGKVHPNMHSQVKSEEGRSLFGVLDKTVSSGGREMLRNWFQFPLQSLLDILERQRAVAFLSDSANTEVLNAIRKYVGKVRPMRTACFRVYTELLLTDLEAFTQFSYAVVQLCRLLLPLENLPELLHEIVKIQESAFVSLGSLIISTVDFDASQKEERIVIQQGVNNKIDYLKQKFAQIDGILADASCEMEAIAGVPVVAVYFPQLGFLSSIDIAHFVDTDIYQNLDGWSLQFQTDMQRYYKNNITLELDKSPGDIFCLIVDAESEVSLELQGEISEQVNMIIHAFDYVSQIDCLQSLAFVAKLHGYREPRFCMTKCIHIKDGRHPILDAATDNRSFISNSVDLAEEDCIHNIGSSKNTPKQVLVLMGPNASGKSVILKQSALLIYMAHIGSHIPATSATFGIVSQIHIVGKSLESLVRRTSAFSADILAIRNMLTQGDSKTLVLLDEFGRGTSAASGIGLLCGMLKHIVSLKNKSPLVMATTHFQEIRHINSIKEIWTHIQLRFMEYKETTTGLVYLFRLTDNGVANSNYAIKCARMAGVPESILQKAQKFTIQ